MAVLLIMAGRQKKIDAWLKADTSSIEELKETVFKYQEENARPTTTTDLMKITGIAFGLTGLAHLFSDLIAPGSQPTHQNSLNTALHQVSSG